MKDINDFPEILETEEIMELFNLSKAGAYRLLRRKDFPSFKLMCLYTVMKKSLLKWLESQEKKAYALK